MQGWLSFIVCALGFDAYVLTVTAHPFCHPKGNVFCHADTRFVKVEALYFVRTPTCFVRTADAPGKTKAINPSCASAQVQSKGKMSSHPVSKMV